MFDRLALGYDRSNILITFGMSTCWRNSMCAAVQPKPGQQILDIAAGTGISSAALAKYGANIVGADFSPGMLSFARARYGKNPLISFVEADAMNLPFDNYSFDAVTISFGLRNIQNPVRAITEFVRVLKPGGCLVICEATNPPNPLVGVLLRAYQKYLMPTLSRLTNSDPDAYHYLSRSIRDWYSQRALAAVLKNAGLINIKWRNLTMGTVALHRGYRTGS